MHVACDDRKSSIKIIDQALAFKLPTSILFPRCSCSEAGVSGYRLSLSFLFLLVQCGANHLHHSFPFPRFTVLEIISFSPKEIFWKTCMQTYSSQQGCSLFSLILVFSSNFISGNRLLPQCKVHLFIHFYFLPSLLIICFRFTMKNNPRKEKGARVFKETRKSSRQTTQPLLKTVQ